MSTKADTKAAVKPAVTEDDGYSKRIEAIRAKRRERGSQNLAGYKLRVDTSKLDPRFEYRWVNEENVQLRRSEATFGGDWEFLPNENGVMDDGRNVEQGAKIARICDRGTGKRTFLMRKPKELYDDDQKIKRERVIKLNEQMQRKGGQTVPKLSGEGEDDTNIYTPMDVARANQTYKP